MSQPQDNSELFNAAFELYQGRALSPERFDEAVKQIIDYGSRCQCAPGVGEAGVASFVIRCDECALLMVASSIGELVRRQLAAQRASL